MYKRLLLFLLFLLIPLSLMAASILPPKISTAQLSPRLDVKQSGVALTPSTGLSQKSIGNADLAVRYKASGGQDAGVILIWTPYGLWHEIDDSLTPAGRPVASPSPKTWWYGQDATGTYETGAANAGSLISTAFIVPADATLELTSFEATENYATADTRTVFITTDFGVNWQILAQLTSENVWYQPTLDLSAFTGQTVALALQFNTGDAIGNNYLGWMVDDIKITISTPPIIGSFNENFDTGTFGPQWSTYGTAPWSVTLRSDNGTYAAEAPMSITDNQSSTLESTITSEEGYLSFRFAVSSEGGWDYLIFSIDGVEQNRWSGFINWSQAPSYPLIAGNHTLTWTYAKDASFSTYEDTAWIDDISFTPGALPVFYGLGIERAGYGEVTADIGTLAWTGNSGTASYLEGTTVTLTPTPATNNTFVGWDGACTGIGTCEVLIDSAKNVTATFTTNSRPYAYIRGAFTPFGLRSNEEAMSTVFGDVNIDWVDHRMADGAAPFSGMISDFIYLDGSENNDVELNAYLAANRPEIEAWVANGGRLFLNSFPYSGAITSLDLGFGGVVVTAPDTGAYFTAVSALVPEHPIFSGPFTPIGVNYTGYYYPISGGGITPLLGMGDAVTLGELQYGAGRVIFGGMTPNGYHNPQPEAANLTANILSYMTTDYLLDISVLGEGSGSVTSNPAGINCNKTGESCSADFASGTKITLTATADLGSRFIGWDGACSGTTPCEVTMSTVQEVSANFALNATGVTVTSSAPSPQATTTVITFTAEATGGDAGPYEYRFWYRSAVVGSKWVAAQAYSTTANYDWNPALLKLAAGSYFIQADTRHVGNLAKSEATKSLTFKVFVAPVPATGIDLTTNVVPPQTAGTTVTITAKASGGDAGPYEYRFWWRSSVAGSTWKVGQNYSSTAKWSWNTAALNLEVGSYFILVDVRHIGNTAKSEATKSLTYQLTPGIALVSSLVSPQPLPSVLTFTAAAKGLDAGPYEYRFWWRPAITGAPWVVGKAYSTAATWEWNPTALGLSAGSYFILVDTRHVGSVVRAEMSKSLTFVLN